MSIKNLASIERFLTMAGLVKENDNDCSVLF